MTPIIKKSYLILLLIFLCSISATAFAEERKDEWKDRNYSFDKMKIILWDPLFAVNNLDGIRQRIIADKLDSQILRDDSKKLAAAGFILISRPDLCQRIEKVTGENMAELAKSDAKRYNELLQQYTAIYCTNILQAKVTAYGETQRYVPERIETYETQKEVTVRKTINNNGKWVEVNETVTVPVTESRVVPAHYISVGHAGMEYTLLDVQTNQPVWQMVDIREAPSKGPDGMLERIINRGVDMLAKLKK